MTKTRAAGRLLAGALAVSCLSLTLGGCESQSISRGYVIDEQALAQIKPGSSAEQVVLVLGTPSTVSTVGGKAYYYISQQVSQRYQFMEKKVTDQRVLAVYLDKNNKVEKLANYGIEDGKLFDFISRTTPTGGAEISMAKQILRGLGAGMFGGIGQ